MRVATVPRELEGRERFHKWTFWNLRCIF